MRLCHDLFRMSKVSRYKENEFLAHSQLGLISAFALAAENAFPFSVFQFYDFEQIITECP